MKDAVLEALNSPLTVASKTDPACVTGEIVVDVVAAPILSYAGEGTAAT